MFQRISATFQSLYWNPLAINNTKKAWKSNKSLTTVVSSACRDFFIDNPHNLVVKNFEKAFKPEKAPTHTWLVQLLINILKKFNITFSKESKICPKLQKAIAAPLVFTGAVYTLMLYGSTAYTVGSAVEKAGKFIGQKETLQTGQFVKLLGKVTFLSGAVPGYIYSLVVKKVVITIPKILIGTTLKVSYAIFRGVFQGHTPMIISIPRFVVKWTIHYPISKISALASYLSITNLAIAAIKGIGGILLGKNTIISAIIKFPFKVIGFSFWAINQSVNGVGNMVKPGVGAISNKTSASISYIDKISQAIMPKALSNLLNSNGLLGCFGL